MASPHGARLPSSQTGNEPARVEVVRQPHGDLRLRYREDVRLGFSARPYTLPTKYLYDREGSLLFEKFAAASPQYYPSAETALISGHAEELGALLAVPQVIELGAGACPRLAQLLDLGLLTSATEYRAVDLSPAPLVDTLAELSVMYPQLNARAAIGDFETWQARDYADTEASTLVLWLGNTAANSSPERLLETLDWIAESFRLCPDFLLGMNLEGPRPDVENRFPDADGYFSRFRWHALTRLNKTLGADFHADRFSLKLAYNVGLDQAESFFVPTCEHSVLLCDLALTVELNMNDRLIVGVTRDYTAATLSEALAPSRWRIESIFGSSASGYALVHIKGRSQQVTGPERQVLDE